MKKKQYYSYSRNNYFFGKLMTVRDFDCEQGYFNNKRCLGNQILNGPGIAYGLDVLLVDNKTISIESGVAIDYSGREIVIAEPTVKKIDSILGFEENCDKGEIYLCVEYVENLEETSFSIVGSGKDSSIGDEYNRIKEGYKLFFTPTKPDEKSLTLDHLFIKKFLVYQKDGVKISVEVPKYVNPGKILKATVVIEKNNVQESVNYKFNINGNLFKSQSDEDIIEVKYQESEISMYKTERKDYYIVCDAVSSAETELIIKSDSFSISVGNNFDIIENDIKLSVNVTDKMLRDVIMDSYYSRPFEEISEIKEGQNIYLAKMNVVSSRSTYFIENFEKHPFNQYVISNSLLDLISKSTDFNIVNYEKHSQNQDGSGDKGTCQENNDDQKLTMFSNVKSGIERVDLGLYAKSGKAYYSCEFIHGLGYGEVGVVLSVENKNTYVTNEPNSLVFGDTTIFKTSEVSMSVPIVSLGAIVNIDKGTMKIGLKLLERTSVQNIDIRWWAFKNEEEMKAIDEEEMSDGIDVSVIISPSTIQIKPLDQVRLTAEVKGSVNQDVKWSLVDDAQGSVDNNGVYIAPAKCGVYEVKATSEKFADKHDSAYIVVSDE